MLEWIEGLINTLGYPAIAFLMMLENVFPPIPSELIMPFAGFAAGRGVFSLPGIVVAGTIGSVAGALILYYGGQLIGYERLTRWADRHGRWLGVSGDDIETARDWFDRHGGKAVFFLRLVPGVRSLISIPAGIARMNMASFLLYTTLGTAIWAAMLAVLGYILGENYALIEPYFSLVSYAVLALIVAGAAIWLWRRRSGARPRPTRQRPRQRDGD